MARQNTPDSKPEDTAPENTEGTEDTTEDPWGSLEVAHDSLGSKNAVVTDIPPSVVKLIDAAWAHTQAHPDQFHRVELKDKATRDEFHTFGKAAAKVHEPALLYRSLPRKNEPENVACFTLRKLTPDTPRPGRKPKSSEETTADGVDNAPSGETSDGASV